MGSSHDAMQRGTFTLVLGCDTCGEIDRPHPVPRATRVDLCLCFSRYTRVILQVSTGREQELLQVQEMNSVYSHSFKSRSSDHAI
jgi:hypothetical protein